MFFLRQAGPARVTSRENTVSTDPVNALCPDNPRAVSPERVRDFRCRFPRLVRIPSLSPRSERRESLALLVSDELRWRATGRELERGLFPLDWACVTDMETELTSGWNSSIETVSRFRANGSSSPIDHFKLVRVDNRSRRLAFLCLG